MKNALLLLLLFPSFLLAQTGNGFVVTGNVNGLSEGTEIKLLTATQEERTLARTSVKDGSFILKGGVPEPGLYRLALGKQPVIYLFLENKNINVSGDVKDVAGLKINGSSSHQDFEEFLRTFNPVMTKVQEAITKLNEAGDEKSFAVLMRNYDSLKKEVDTQVEKFVAAKPASYVTAFLLTQTANLLDDPVTLQRRFRQLDENVRSSLIGRSLNDYIAYSLVGAVGTEALDFTQNDTNGVPVSLSSFKGKYVLVDFWASWCKPCRIENPNVVKVYQKFSDKNFTVLGVSLDKEKEPWLKAIEKDKLTWTQVSDLKYWENAVAQLYHVQGIPQNFLIDPQGKIVAKNLRGEALEAKLCELLGCN